MKCQRRLVQLRRDVSGIGGGVRGDRKAFTTLKVFLFESSLFILQIKKKDFKWHEAVMDPRVEE